MGAIFGAGPGSPPPPPPVPPAANPPIYASSAVQGTAQQAKAVRAGMTAGFADTVKTDALGGLPPTTSKKELLGA